ncbi:hypothetical protein C8R44DRAFT_749854 [Mycena epipterygia]|nr:hypothetical protein C8R44DRAFT_749854 [Mycena epipterygia]
MSNRYDMGIFFVTRLFSGAGATLSDLNRILRKGSTPMPERAPLAPKSAYLKHFAPAESSSPPQPDIVAIRKESNAARCAWIYRGVNGTERTIIVSNIGHNHGRLVICVFYNVQSAIVNETYKYKEVDRARVSGLDFVRVCNEDRLHSACQRCKRSPALFSTVRSSSCPLSLDTNHLSSDLSDGTCQTKDWTTGQLSHKTICGKEGSFAEALLGLFSAPSHWTLWTTKTNSFLPLAIPACRLHARASTSASTQTPACGPSHTQTDSSSAISLRQMPISTLPFDLCGDRNGECNYEGDGGGRGERYCGEFEFESDCEPDECGVRLNGVGLVDDICDDGRRFGGAH